MKAFVATMAFLFTYCCLYICIAGFFAAVTPMSFYDISAHPGYMVSATIPYLFVAGFVSSDVYKNYGQAKTS